MRFLLAQVVIGVAIFAVTESDLIEDSLQKHLFLNNGFLKILYDTLASECPTYIRSTRELIEVSHEVHTTLQMKLYTQLFHKLIECRAAKQTTAATTKMVKTSQPILTTSTEQTTTDYMQHTTTVERLPEECKHAVNYTQIWRLEHRGFDMKTGIGPTSYDGFACDLHRTNIYWFRFAGLAGNRMLDSCPQYKSCGTKYPLWTDEPMPKSVGVEAAVTVYRASFNGVCKDRQSYKVMVMRCSWDTPHDLIYKQTTNYQSPCSVAFCGTA